MVDQKTNTTPPKKARNWTRIALLASLAVNLLIVAAMAGAFWSNTKPSGRHLDRMSLGLGVYIRALPDVSRDDVMVLVGKGHKDRKQFFREMREQQKVFEMAVLTEPFSPDAVRDAMENYRGIVLGKTVRIQEAYLTALTKMTEAERAAHFEQVKALKAERQKRRKRKSKE
jgi:hypothetical protein